MATLYWNPASGQNFSSATAWATTPTGTPNQPAPTNADTCYFTNQNSQTCTISGTCNCLDVDFTSGTGFTGTLTGSGAWGIYGSVNWGTKMTNSYTGTITYAAVATGKTITGTRSPASSLTFNGVGGNWTFSDSPVASTTKTYTVTNGAVNFNGKTYSIYEFYSDNSNTRGITLGASSWTMAGAWSINSNTGLTFSGTSATISGVTTFTGSGQAYGTVSCAGNVAGGNSSFVSLTITGATKTLSGDNTITTLVASNTPLALSGSNTIVTLTSSGAAQQFTVTDTKTQTITNCPSGTAGNVITWTGSSTAGWNMSKASGLTKLAYTNMSYSTATGGAVFILDKTCTSTSGNNSGWIQEYSSYGGYLSKTSGILTYDLSTASGTTVILHGLNKIPSRITFNCNWGSTTASNLGSCNGLITSVDSKQGCEYTYSDTAVGTGQSTFIFTSSTAGIHFSASNDDTKNQNGIVTASATSITITWTKTSTPTGSAAITWTAE